MKATADFQVKALLVNVGGATAPAIHALNTLKPPYICFFVSQETKDIMQKEILPKLEYTYIHHDWIQTNAAQNLIECYRALERGLPRILEKWGVDWSELGIEYTAGTKPMSVAAVLVTIEKASKYFYVGSQNPSDRKGEIGVVLDGKEYIWFQLNPWEELAVPMRRDISMTFNLGRFAEARERAEKLCQVVPQEMKRIYQALADLIHGYELWDRFDIKRAHDYIFRSLDTLQSYIAGKEEPLRKTLEQVQKNADFLKRLLSSKDDEYRHLRLLDRIANADRRAKLASKYDDAVARLYSVLEALARYRLWSRYQIKNHQVQIDQVPEEIRQEFKQRYADDEKGGSTLRLGLEASYRLLEALGDDLGKNYRRNYNEVQKVLYARNQSILAHGEEPVKPEVYTSLRKIILDFAAIDERDLPLFPEMSL